MTEHTKEPWKSIERSWHHEYAADLAGPDGRLVASIKHPEDARRVVDCVNALAGVRDEVLSAVAQTSSRRLSICILIGALQALRDQTAEG